jgi:hypothetical protein
MEDNIDTQGFTITSRPYIIDYVRLPKLNSNEIQFMNPFQDSPDMTSIRNIVNIDSIESVEDIQLLYDRLLSYSKSEVENYITSLLDKKLELYQDRNPWVHKYSPRKKNIKFFSEVLLRDVQLEINDYELREWSKGRYFGRSMGKIISK